MNQSHYQNIFHVTIGVNLMVENVTEMTSELIISVDMIMLGILIHVAI